MQDEQESKKLRIADFKVGFVLLVISIAILIETLSFPMEGSYGGVESQWYVSPALFPLIIVTTLLISTFLLLLNAVKAQGYKNFLQLKSWIGDYKQQINRDRWYVIYQLVLFIYVFIPSCDFYLSTVLFLTAITFRFYIDAPRLALPLLSLQFAVVLGLMALRANLLEEFYIFSLDPVSDEKLILWSDILLLGNIILNIIFLFIFYKPNLKTLLRLAATCLLVPLFLVFVFSFLLYIPMPVEYGTVSDLLGKLWYDVLGM